MKGTNPDELESSDQGGKTLNLSNSYYLAESLNRTNFITHTDEPNTEFIFLIYDRFLYGYLIPFHL